MFATPRRWDVAPSRGVCSAITLAGDALHPMTPNLGQGACTALEDAVLLARHLEHMRVPELLAAAALCAHTQQAIGDAFAAYERERTARCLPLTLRSHVMGAALQVRCNAGVHPGMQTQGARLSRVKTCSPRAAATIPAGGRCTRSVRALRLPALALS